jgi:hypothetical protein
MVGVDVLYDAQWPSHGMTNAKLLPYYSDNSDHGDPKPKCSDTENEPSPVSETVGGNTSLFTIHGEFRDLIEQYFSSGKLKVETFKGLGSK